MISNYFLMSMLDKYIFLFENILVFLLCGKLLLPLQREYKLI